MSVEAGHAPRSKQNNLACQDMGLFATYPDLGLRQLFHVNKSDRKISSQQLARTGVL